MCDDEGRRPYKAWSFPGVVETNQCPRRWLPGEVWQWLGLYEHYKNGHLVQSGGILEQPAAYMEMMRLISQLVGRSVAEAQKEHGG